MNPFATFLVPITFDSPEGPETHTFYLVIQKNILAFGSEAAFLCAWEIDGDLPDWNDLDEEWIEEELDGLLEGWVEDNEGSLLSWLSKPQPFIDLT